MIGTKNERECRNRKWALMAQKSNWTTEEHILWGKMLQEGKDFEAISKALKTKSVDSCKKRVFVIRRNMLKYHHHFKFPIEKKLMDLIQTVDVDEPIVIQTTRKNDDRWRASEH